jgi:predicted nucleotidyltransferase component of viral defense system
MDIKTSPYFGQVKLLLQVLPHVVGEKCFVLKGGTAINLFLRDMPRLSVDIDLTYLPIESREISLSNISAALKRIAKGIMGSLPDARIQEVALDASGMIGKLIVRRQEAQIKIEPNFVIRGVIFPAEERVLSRKAQDAFEMFVLAKTASLADLYGGKICAALDRQHPRDFYDIKFLFDNEGITETIRKGFIVYLISHDRPMHEVIKPTMKDFRKVFDTEFLGMTDDSVTYEELVQVRSKLIDALQRGFTKEEKEFLISFKSAEPQWQLLGVAGVETLPAVLWKQMNIQKMNPAKRALFIEKLREVL